MKKLGLLCAVSLLCTQAQSQDEVAKSVVITGAWAAGTIVAQKSLLSSLVTTTKFIKQNSSFLNRMTALKASGTLIAVTTVGTGICAYKTVENAYNTVKLCNK